MKWFIFSIFLAGCNSNYQTHIAELKIELNKAEGELTIAKERVLNLQEALAKKEIARIRNELDEMEKKKNALNKKESLPFFSEQRETLAYIIKNHALCAAEAQSVLDEILILITQMSDSE